MTGLMGVGPRCRRQCELTVFHIERLRDKKTYTANACQWGRGPLSAFIVCMKLLIHFVDRH
jgi:hypothetical protein